MNDEDSRSLSHWNMSRLPVPHDLRKICGFLLVGGSGFIIDATVLTLLTHFAGWTPWHARIPSFLTAVLVTWVLNRRYTFINRGLRHKTTEALGYTLIQTGGALINLAIFGVCLHFFATLRALPVIPLSVGAVGGFAFNYLLSDQLLYRKRRDNS